MGQPVKHWQILAKNPARAADFYRSLFGWSIDAGNSLGYRMVDTNAPGGANGGIWPAPPEAQAMVTLYVEVEDVARGEACRGARSTRRRPAAEATRRRRDGSHRRSRGNRVRSDEAQGDIAHSASPPRMAVVGSTPAARRAGT